MNGNSMILQKYFLNTKNYTKLYINKYMNTLLRSSILIKEN